MCHSFTVGIPKISEGAVTRLAVLFFSLSVCIPNNDERKWESSGMCYLIRFHYGDFLTWPLCLYSKRECQFLVACFFVVAVLSKDFCRKQHRTAITKNEGTCDSGGIHLNMYFWNTQTLSQIGKLFHSNGTVNI